MLTAEQVAEFLRQNPGFFENHADVLVNLQIPHPHGGRAVSIGERQLVALREKSRLLEDKLRELIAFGEDNDAVGEKVHRLSCRLIDAPSLDAALDTLYLDLLDHFAVPHVAVRSGAWRGESRDQGVRARGRRDARVHREEPAPIAAPCGVRKPGVVRRGCGAPEVVRARGRSARDGLTFGVWRSPPRPKRLYPEMARLPRAHRRCC